MIRFIYYKGLLSVRKPFNKIDYSMPVFGIVYVGVIVLLS